MPVTNLRQKKSELRARYRKMRENFPPERKSAADSAIAERLFSLPEYIDSDLILAFVSKDIEVDTSAIIEHSLSMGKRVAVPRCDTDSTEINYYIINSLSDLEQGTYGLLEPKLSVCERVSDFSDSVCIVPGMVFDRDGYRIGFGKGYYDRFIMNYTGAKVGICYSKCIIPELPKGYYDRPMDIVVTDKYNLDTRNR